MFDCVIPAAGASSRMGAFKPSLSFGASTVAGTTVRAALDAGCRVVLVVGNRGSELAALFRGMEGLLVVDNPSWKLGMLGSLQAGLRLVRSEAFFTIPADMPLVPSSAYGLLAAAWASRLSGGGQPAALFAASEGRRGHPALIPSVWIPEILGLDPGGRMKDFLESRPSALVEAGTEAVLADLDSPEDYERAKTAL